MTTNQIKPLRATASGTVAQSLLPVWAIVLLVGVVIGTIGVTVFAYRAFSLDWWALLRDPSSHLDFVPSMGLFSHLGVLALAMAGAICVFVATAPVTHGHDRPMLLFAGVMSVWLAVDDLFLVHESMIPRHTGIPENAVLGFYVVLALGLFWRIGWRVFSRSFLGLWVATAFLGVMLATDLAFEVATSPSFLVEEVAKQCGWIIWAAFWIAFARQSLFKPAGMAS